MIIEPDATWSSSTTDLPALIRTKLAHHGMVTLTDKSSYNLVNPGFLALRGGDPKVIEMLTRVVAVFSTKIRTQCLDGKLASGHECSGCSEQVILNNMLADERYDVSMEWLPKCEYAAGFWYHNETYRNECPRPWVILNNWIKGRDNKVGRAKKWGHWLQSQRPLGLSLTLKSDRQPSEKHVVFVQETWWFSQDWTCFTFLAE